MFEGDPVKKNPSTRVRNASGSSGGSSAGTRRGVAPEPSRTAAMYFSPAMWNGCEPTMRKSQGMPTTGMRAFMAVAYHAPTRRNSETRWQGPCAERLALLLAFARKRALLVAQDEQRTGKVG